MFSDRVAQHCGLTLLDCLQAVYDERWQMVPIHVRATLFFDKLTTLVESPRLTPEGYRLRARLRNAELCRRAAEAQTTMGGLE